MGPVYRGSSEGEGESEEEWLEWLRHVWAEKEAEEEEEFSLDDFEPWAPPPELIAWTLEDNERFARFEEDLRRQLAEQEAREREEEQEDWMPPPPLPPPPPTPPRLTLDVRRGGA